MAKLNYWIILLFVFVSIFSIASLSLSIWIYNMGFGAKISTQASSEGQIEFSVEGSGAVCGDSFCNGLETCSTCVADCGSCPATTSSGGGGGVSTASSDFKISKDEFNLKIVSGEKGTNEFYVENIGSIPITISLEVTGIRDYISLSANSISLSPRQSVPVVFTINAPEPGIYAGKIILKYQGITREVLIIVNVVSEGVLFDTFITIPELYRIISVGQRLPALIEIVEIGKESRVDVTINYLIKDFNGNTKFTESETFYITGIKKYNKIFYTNNLEPGDYALGIELIYSGGFATSSTPFTVSASENLIRVWVGLGVLFMAVVFIALLVIFIRRHDEESDLKEVVK